MTIFSKKKRNNQVTFNNLIGTNPQLEEMAFHPDDSEGFAAEWDEVAQVTYLRRALTALEDLVDRIPEDVRGYVVDELKSAANLVSNLENLTKLSKVPRSIRRKKEKVAMILLNSVTKDVTNVTNFLAVLMAIGVSGAVISSIALGGSFLVAALASTVAVASTVSLYRSTRAYYSPSYRVSDQLNKYKKITKRVDELEEEIKRLEEQKRVNQEEYIKNKEAIMKEEAAKIARLQMQKQFSDPVAEYIHALEKEIEMLVKKAKQAEIDHLKQNDKIENDISAKMMEIELLQKKQDMIAHHALAIVQVENKRASEKGKNNRISNDLKDRFNRITHNQYASELNKKADPEMVKFVSEMKKNKRDDVISNAVSTFSYSLIAVGATLIAIAPFTAHAAPVIFAVGLAINLTGLTILLGMKFGTRLTNFVSKRHAFSQERKELQKDYSDGRLDHARLKTLDPDMQLKYRLSFEQKKDKSMTEDEWYRHLDGLTSKERRHILQDSEKKVINEKILSEALGVATGHVMLSQIPESTKQRIINRASRHQLRVSITEGIATGFKKTHQFVKNQLGVAKDYVVTTSKFSAKPHDENAELSSNHQGFFFHDDHQPLQPRLDKEAPSPIIEPHFTMK